MARAERTLSSRGGISSYHSFHSFLSYHSYHHEDVVMGAQENAYTATLIEDTSLAGKSFMSLGLPCHHLPDGAYHIFGHVFSVHYGA